MPWLPELFSAPVVERVSQRNLQLVPYFDGLRSGELDGLIGSFAGEPQVVDPVRGRVQGVTAFTDYVEETNAWLRRRNVEIELVADVMLERRGFSEHVLHLEGADLPFAIGGDLRRDRRIEELRIYLGRDGDRWLT